jgi:hypothetical protein
MKKTTTVVPFRQADSIGDLLTEIAREGARRAYSDVTGHLFRFEGGHVFRSDAGQRSDLMPAT